jgi:two-component system LytT family sensor kinase
MSSSQSSSGTLFGRSTSEGRKVFRLQMLLLFILSTFLYIGFPGTREWRRLAEERQMHTIIRGWDGLAWYTWLAAAPVMLAFIRRFPLTRGQMRTSLARILVGSMGLYLVVTHVRYVLRVLPDLDWRNPMGQLLNVESYAYNTFALLPLDVLTYCGFFAVSFSVDYYFKHRQRAEEARQLQLRTAQLESDLARAELAALRGQLHPHFLFNSFNALATLVRQQKNEAAVEIIAQLSALLRLAIERTGLQEIPLHQELDFIQRYLDIEHVRFGDKLRVEFALEPASLDALVPNIVLQPLVENAIKHGISLRTTPGAVRLASSRRGSRLHIEIADDGADGPSPACTEQSGGKRQGIGLANTRAQLDKLYGLDYQLKLTKQPEGGTVVTLELPWRTAPAA